MLGSYIPHSRTRVPTINTCTCAWIYIPPDNTSSRINYTTNLHSNTVTGEQKFCISKPLEHTNEMRCYARGCAATLTIEAGLSLNINWAQRSGYKNAEKPGKAFTSAGSRVSSPPSSPKHGRTVRVLIGMYTTSFRIGCQAWDGFTSSRSRRRRRPIFHFRPRPLPAYASPRWRKARRPRQRSCARWKM